MFANGNSYGTSSTFFDIDKSYTKHLNSKATALARGQYKWAYDYYIDYYELSTSMKNYEIQAYSFQDVSGELGGQLKILESVMVIMLLGYPNFSYILTAMGKLYLGKTQDGTVLNKHKEKYNKRLAYDKQKEKYKDLTNLRKED